MINTCKLNNDTLVDYQVELNLIQVQNVGNSVRIELTTLKMGLQTLLVDRFFMVDDIKLSTSCGCEEKSLL